MKLKHWLYFHAVLAIIYMPLLIFCPGWLFMLLTGNSTDQTSLLGLRLLGAAMILIILNIYQSISKHDYKIQKMTAITLFTYVSAGSVISLFAQLQGGWNILGWSNFGTYFILALGYFYFLFLKKEK